MFANFNINTKGVIRFFFELLVTSLVLYAVVLVLNGVNFLVDALFRFIFRMIGFDRSEEDKNDGLSLRQLVGAVLLSILLACALFKWFQHRRSRSRSSARPWEFTTPDQRANQKTTAPEGVTEAV